MAILRREGFESTTEHWIWRSPVVSIVRFSFFLDVLWGQTVTASAVFLRSRLRIFAVTVLLMCGTSAMAQVDPGTKPTSDPARQTAREKVRQAYKAEYAKLDTADAREKLARKLIGSANKAQSDPERREALLDEAVELAVSAGDVTVAMAVATGRHASGSNEALEYQAAVLQMLAETKLSDEQRRLLADHLNLAVRDALLSTNFPVARQIAELSVVAARHRSAALALKQLKSAEEILSTITELEGLHDEFVAAQKTLESEADNPPANLIAGTFLGFGLGDWSAAEQHLSRAGEDWTKLMQRDANPPKDGPGLWRLGDTWLEEAVKAPRVYRSGMLRRAAYWYAKAEPLAAAADRKLLQEKLALIAEADVLAPETPTASQPKDVPVVEQFKPLVAAAAPAAGGAPKAKKTAPKILLPFTILGARYGSDSSNVDLTQRLQQAAKGGLLVLDVNNTLTVERRVGGRLLLRAKIGPQVSDMTFDDREIVFLDAREPAKIKGNGLVILDAFYGTGIWGEEMMVDVKDRVATAAAAGKNTTVRDIINGLKDPCFGKPKILIVRYAQQGRIGIERFEEDDEVKF